jgi:hypothetical protein
MNINQLAEAMMCCPECEDYIDEDGCCSCTPDDEAYGVEDEEDILDSLYMTAFDYDE